MTVRTPKRGFIYLFIMFVIMLIYQLTDIEVLAYIGAVGFIAYPVLIFLDILIFYEHSSYKGRVSNIEEPSVWNISKNYQHTYITIKTNYKTITFSVFKPEFLTNSQIEEPRFGDEIEVTIRNTKLFNMEYVKRLKILG